MGITKDMTGQKIGRLTVIRANGQSRTRQMLWLCQCECGNQSTVFGGDLRDGHTRSCGCLKTELNIQRHTTHDGSRRMRKNGIREGHPLYDIWIGIRHRCHHQTNREYPRYGGRGIKMHPAWYESFPIFVSAVGERPSLEHSIDRIDNDGNYEPGNVRWATPKEQRRNSGKPISMQREIDRLTSENTRLISELRLARELAEKTA